MPAGGLAPCVARPTAVMVLMVQDKGSLVLNEEEFQLPVSSKY